MRDYDPTTGRYIQADPLGLVDGASVYGYVGQNPGRYSDFFGLQSDVANPGGGGIDIGDIIGGGFSIGVRIGGKLIGGTIGLILTPSAAGRGSDLPISKIVEMECGDDDDGCREWFNELSGLYDELVLLGPEYWPSFEIYNDAAEKYNQACVPRGHPSLPLILLDPRRR